MQLRNHYGTIRKVLRWFSIELKPLESYDVNLRKYLESVKKKKEEDHIILPRLERKLTTKFPLPIDDPQSSFRNENEASIYDELERLKRARKVSVDIGIASQNQTVLTRRKRGNRHPSSIMKEPTTQFTSRVTYNTKRGLMKDNHFDDSTSRQPTFKDISPEDSIERNIAMGLKEDPRPLKLVDDFDTTMISSPFPADAWKNKNN